MTIEMRISEAQMSFNLTLTPTTVDDVLADRRFIATDYLGESFSELSEVGKATPGENLYSGTLILHLFNEISLPDGFIKEPYKVWGVTWTVSKPFIVCIPIIHCILKFHWHHQQQ